MLLPLAVVCALDHSGACFLFVTNVLADTNERSTDNSVTDRDSQLALHFFEQRSFDRRDVGIAQTRHLALDSHNAAQRHRAYTTRGNREKNVLISHADIREVTQ